MVLVSYFRVSFRRKKKDEGKKDEGKKTSTPKEDKVSLRSQGLSSLCE
jgi:hypothetical protein